MPVGCLKSIKVPLPQWYLLPLEEWQMNTREVSFALLRSALLCLRGSCCMRRASLNITDNDFEINKGLARIKD